MNHVNNLKSSGSHTQTQGKKKTQVKLSLIMHSKTLVCEQKLFCTHAYNPKHCISKRISRTIGSVVIMWCLVSHTPSITRHRSFIKLKCIRNVCLFCRTLTEQVTLNMRFYCIYTYNILNVYVYFSIKKRRNSSTLWHGWTLRTLCLVK